MVDLAGWVASLDARGGVDRGPAQLATAGGRSARTVSAVLRWAREVGLVAVVEPGASAAFLGSKTNRAPSYVVLASPGPGHSHSPPAGLGRRRGAGP